jgi:hypothetical protein
MRRTAAVSPDGIDVPFRTERTRQQKRTKAQALVVASVSRKDRIDLHEKDDYPYLPCRNEAFLLANRKVLADQYEYLAARLPKHSRLRLH